MVECVGSCWSSCDGGRDGGKGADGVVERIVGGHSVIAPV